MLSAQNVHNQNTAQATMDSGGYNDGVDEASLIQLDGLYYQRGEDTQPYVGKPWLSNLWSRLYDAIMERWIFPHKFNGLASTHNRYMAEILAETNKNRVLEIGTGSGVASNWLDKTSSYRGVDISPALLKIAQKRFSGRGFTDARLYAMEAVPLPFRSCSFDLCLCILTLNFIEDEIALFRAFHRVLGTGGTFVCCVPVPEACGEGVKIRGALRSESVLRAGLNNCGFSFSALPYENGALLYFKAVKEGQEEE